MCIGILSDGTAPSPVFKMFDDVWPGGGPARWTRGLHSQREDKTPYRADRGGGVVVLHEHCYGSPMLTVGDQLTGLSTCRGAPVTAYFRFSGFETLCTLNGYRLLTDNALFLRKQGIGRIGFDFWNVVPSRREADNERHIYNRFPHSSCAQRAPAMYHLSWPGPDGAEPTMRFELLIEGIQTADAMIVVAEAQGEKAGKFGPEFAAKCRRVFLDRFNYTRQHLPEPWAVPFLLTFHQGWQELDRRVFDCAAEVAAASEAGET
jgi:hypothetical protein